MKKINNKPLVILTCVILICVVSIVIILFGTRGFKGKNQLIENKNTEESVLKVTEIEDV